MKNVSVKLFGVIALIAVIAFSMAACSDSSGDAAATFSRYTGVSFDGDTYSLVISDSAGRAAYNPKVGDSYELTVTPANHKSVGTVTGVDGGFELLPDGGSEGDEFSVMVDGGTMIAIGGNIKCIDDTLIEAMAAFVINSGNPISGVNIAVDVPVVYEVSDLTEAKSRTEFNNKAEMTNPPWGDPVGYPIGDFLDAPSSVTVSDGKVTIILQEPIVALIDLADLFKTVMFLPEEPAPKYFGTEADPIVFMDNAGPADENTYGLVCARDNTHLVGLTYVDRAVRMIGTDVSDDPEAPAKYTIFDCVIEKGWNYVYTTITGAPVIEGQVSKNMLITSSTSLLPGYKWTVIDHNYFN